MSANDQSQPVNPPPPADPHDPYAALRLTGFRLFITGTMGSVMSSQIQNLTAGWAAYDRRREAQDLAWIALSVAVPMMLCTLPAGQVADRFPRKRVIMIAQTVMLGCAFTLSYLASIHAPLSWTCAVLCISSAAATFGRPARQALMPALAQGDVFPNAVAWHSSGVQLAVAAGPAIGGALLGFGAWIAYLGEAACLLCALVCTALLRVPEGADRGHIDVGRRSLAGIADGLRFVFSTRVVLAAMTLDLFAVLFGGVTYLLPIFAKEILHVEEQGLGLLRAAPGAGAVLMALFIAHRPPMKKAGRAMLLSVGGFGLATLIFGISQDFYLSLGMLFLLGALDNISVVVRHSLVQLVTPDAMRGRVSAVNSLFIGASNELGGARASVAVVGAQHLSAATGLVMNAAVFSAVSGGVASLMVVGLVAWFWPELGRVGLLRDVKAEKV